MRIIISANVLLVTAIIGNAQQPPQCALATVLSEGREPISGKLACGPHGTKVLYSDGSLKYVKAVSDIQNKVPLLEISLGLVKQITFLDMTNEEKQAVADREGSKKDYFHRQWHKVDLTLQNGTSIKGIFYYDGCSIDSTGKVATLEELHAKTVTLRPGACTR